MIRTLARDLPLPAAVVVALVMFASLPSCARSPRYRSFAAPEDAVRALIEAVAAGNVDEVAAIFGPERRDLIDSSDPAAASRNQQVFAAAVAERWRLEDRGPGVRVLVVGNEDWPFPVPIVKSAAGWRFDTAAGREEVLARRIGRNELAAIQICRTYVAAQRIYARRGHDGRPAGLYAAAFRSDPGTESGLYWVAGPGQKRSPLGDLVAHAANDGRPIGQPGSPPSPFHGYYFRILTGQGPAAAGGAMNYVEGGMMSRGFAMVAWPAQYDVTGIMTFMVNHDGVVREKSLGAGTDAAVREMTLYDPDNSWGIVQ